MERMAQARDKTHEHNVKKHKKEEMNQPEKEEFDKLLRKYQGKLKAQLDIPSATPSKDEEVKVAFQSREYKQFKRDIMPDRIIYYEKACAISEKILKMKPNKKKLPKLLENIETAHLNVTPEGVASFAMLAPITIMFLGAIFSFMFFQSMFLVVFFFLGGLGLMKPIENIPDYIATSWRMKASNQMVLCVFYVVTYMRHTSNLEKAIEFASEHLTPPLSLDLRKVLWDVETGKFDSVKDSLENYLEGWREHNLEFVEAMHLIQSSLFEASEDRRLTLLDKSLDVMLDETYEKMMHYAHGLKSPITMLHMLGVILPILGLVILPLVVSFMEGARWYHIAVLYDLLLPVVVYIMGKRILATRPTGYGDVDISEYNPELKRYKNFVIKLGKKEIFITPLSLSILVGGLLIFIGFLPLFLHMINPYFDMDIGPFKLLDYKPSKANPDIILGPFGLGAAILSLLIPFGIAAIIGIYNRFRSKNLIKIREESKKLETEFASALFQLGNRLGDGIPAEIAFGKVSEVMRGTISGNFFEHVSSNVKRMGMGIREAIFSPVNGALKAFPSNIIDSSMKVLMQSALKGPKIAAQALLNISRYVKEIHKVDERLKDLLSDIISSMKSQISFLTPVIAGIVIGITSMITGIIGKLGAQMSVLGSEAGASTAGLVDMFGDGIPSFHFQIIVGLYVVQLVYILTILSNGIENGSDKLNERYLLGKNMLKGVGLYCAVAFVVMMIFNSIASVIMGNIATVG